MRTLALPKVKHLTLGEFGFARCGYFLKQLTGHSQCCAKYARALLRLTQSVAVRREIPPAV